MSCARDKKSNQKHRKSRIMPSVLTLPTDCTNTRFSSQLLPLNAESKLNTRTVIPHEFTSCNVDKWTYRMLIYHTAPPRAVPKPEDNAPTSIDILRAAQAAGAFDFWDNPADDIYSLDDGESA